MYQHEFRSFNDRSENPPDFFGSTLSVPDDQLPGPPQVPDTPAGFYTHRVLPRHTTQDDSLQVTMSGGAPRQFQWSRQLRAIGGPVHESSHVCGQQLCDDHAQWNIVAGYTYLQDNLRTDVRFANDPTVGL